MEPDNFIYTIGHGNRPIEELLDAVLSYDIDYLIDVRSTPYSSYCPQFARESISEAINATGRTKYAYLGDQLGGYPKEPEYQRDGKTDYIKYSESERFQAGIARLKKGCSELGLRLCIMCSESDPTNCHRTRLISNELEKIGVRVRHIVYLPDTKAVDEDTEAMEEKDHEEDLCDARMELNQSDPIQTPSETFIKDEKPAATVSRDHGYPNHKVKTILLTHDQVLSGAVKKLKDTGSVPPDTYPEGGLFS